MKIPNRRKRDPLTFCAAKFIVTVAFILTGCNSKPRNCEELFVLEARSNWPKIEEAARQANSKVESALARDAIGILRNSLGVKDKSQYIQSARHYGRELDKLGFSVDGCYELTHLHQQKVTCSRCNGSGYVTQQWLDNNYIKSWRPGNCRLCLGEGKLSNQKQKEGEMQALQQAEIDRRN
jgi:hypothetical protein